MEPDKSANLMYNVQANCYVKFILKNKRGCRDIYDTLIPVDETIAPVKWLQEINDITVVEWKMYNKNLNQIKEVKLKDFQYKILNRILVTNRFLYKTKRKETDKCSYCNTESESISHLLFSCEKVNEFWKTLKIWLLNNANISLHYYIFCFFPGIDAFYNSCSKILYLPKHFLIKNAHNRRI